MSRLKKWFGIAEIVEELKTLNKILSTHMPITNERLLAIEAALTEGATEIVDEITKLKEQLANNDPAAEATLGRIETIALRLKDLSPPVTPPPTP